MKKGLTGAIERAKQKNRKAPKLDGKQEAKFRKTPIIHCILDDTHDLLRSYVDSQFSLKSDRARLGDRIATSHLDGAQFVLAESRLFRPPILSLGEPINFRMGRTIV